MESKQCTKCGEVKPLSGFSKDRYHKNGLVSQCKTCKQEYDKKYYYAAGGSERAKEKGRRFRKSHPRYGVERNHRLGISKPLSENRKCAPWLGDIAERVLSGFFDNIIRMPYGHPGYDFICGKGFKIDVKSSCQQTPPRSLYKRWNFHIEQNKIADYFLCVAFDNRELLTPLHVWLFPGNVVNHFIGINIFDNPKSTGFVKWSKYERPLDKVLKCCTALKEKK